MIEVNNLSYDLIDKPLLTDINFTLKPGWLLHLRGPNGSGKTTLLKLLMGMLFPLHGEITYQGFSIYKNEKYQKQIGYVGHKLGISQLLSIREHLNLELPTHTCDSTFNDLLSLFSLNDVADLKVGLLSAGQKRRAGLLRLFIDPTSIWFLDEPFVALDQSALLILMERIQGHLENNGLIILTSHQALPIKIKNYQEYSL